MSVTVAQFSRWALMYKFWDSKFIMSLAQIKKWAVDFGLCIPKMNISWYEYVGVGTWKLRFGPFNLGIEDPTPSHLVYFYINQCVQLNQIEPNLVGSILINAVILGFHVLLKLESASLEKEDA